MTIGDQPAFPSEQSECQDGTWNQTGASGMTYRQWLVGQIAGGASEDLWRSEGIDAIYTILNRADAIIKRLEEK